MASLLAQRVAGALKDTPARASVPQKTAELRVTRLDDTVTLEEMAAAVAGAGGSRTDEENRGGGSLKGGMVNGEGSASFDAGPPMSGMRGLGAARVSSDGVAGV
jgi:hypothetical protein